MTDARLPDRMLSDRRLMRLGPEQFRAFVLALVWSVSNRTEGEIEHGDADLVPGLDDLTAAALVRAGLWRATEAGWSIVDFEATQSSRAELEAAERARASARDRKARQRERDRERDADRDGHRDSDRDSTGEAGTGKAGQGKRRRTSTAPRPPAAFEDAREGPW